MEGGFVHVPSEDVPVPVVSEEFEVRRHNIGRRPVLPTKAVIAEHFPLHLNYRSWCKHCVAGRARSTPHKAKEEGQDKMGVTMHADYAFMGGEYNESEVGMQASLGMYDDDKDSFWAAGVDKKGASEAMVSFAVGVSDRPSCCANVIRHRSSKQAFSTCFFPHNSRSSATHGRLPGAAAD